jgi:tagatose 6-phosphate kinase
VIITVCLNPALDITHRVPAVNWSGVNRPAGVWARPGGKGLNVARTLHAIGAQVLAMGLAGGATGQAVQSALAQLRVPAALTPISGETRRTFAVADDSSGEVALFNEPGPLVSAGEYREFSVQYQRALAGCRAVVLSGSLPRGLPPGTYAELTGLAAAAGVPVLLDAHGEALTRALAAGPAVVKPNLAELEEIVGRSLSGAGWAAVARAARELRTAGARAVVVSLGPCGVWASTGDGDWRAVPAAAVAANPTGAGDALAAGLAQGLVLGRPWPHRLRHAVALATASVAAPVAGEFSQGDYDRALAGIRVSRDEAG